MLLDTLLAGFKNLGRKKFRSWLTILGISIGVASVVLITSIGDIGKETINQELNSLGMGGLMVSGGSQNSQTVLTHKHLEVIRESAAVERAIPITVDYLRSYMRGLMMDAVVWGVDSGANQVIPMEALYGRVISSGDVAGKNPVCVVDQNLAKAYYKRDNIVGKTLTLQIGSRYEDFEIVGVVNSGGNILQGLIGNYIPSFIYMPYTTYQDMTGRVTFDQIAVKTGEGIDSDVVSSQLVTALNQLSGTTSGYKAENMFAQKEKLNTVLDIVTLVLSAIAAVSLVVAGLGIMTIMLVSVNERTREIGIKKSIGASRRDILWEFLVEAFTISFLGGIIGTVIGTGITLIGCIPLQIHPQLNTELIVFCVLLTVVIGVIFGVYPASMAAGLKPVDALRHE
ncbi:ABC transporter permease [Oscillospiraceae bacterium MB08-C2-2]|nr:ABC transporter permease [Oscillospiraceae bacterium MB08-C2-2]